MNCSADEKRINQNEVTTIKGLNLSADVPYCEVTSDDIICWPRTHPGDFAIVPCPKYFQEVQLSEGNAFRFCHENGTWDGKSNYSECEPIDKAKEDEFHSYVIRVIYYVVFTISIVVLFLALFIFLYFRSLRCLRNTIHCHLIATFIAKYLLWLKMVPTMPLLAFEEQSLVHEFACKFIISLFNYFLVTNFFWMLVEGLYLHTVIVWAFSYDRIHFWQYAIIGWCVPLVFVIVWALLKLHFDNNICWLPVDSFTYDFVLIAPIFLVLFMNLVFLLNIVWTLVTKLRASNSSQNCLYRKATKATVILFPLLGLTYILFLWTPSHLVFKYINAILQSAQGIFVAFFYCFLNSEVKNAVEKRAVRWREGRSISAHNRRTSNANTEQMTIQWSSLNTSDVIRHGHLTTMTVNGESTNGDEDNANALRPKDVRCIRCNETQDNATATQTSAEGDLFLAPLLVCPSPKEVPHVICGGSDDDEYSGPEDEVRRALVRRARPDIDIMEEDLV